MDRRRRRAGEGVHANADGGHDGGTRAGVRGDVRDAEQRGAIDGVSAERVDARSEAICSIRTSDASNADVVELETNSTRSVTAVRRRAPRRETRVKSRERLGERAVLLAAATRVDSRRRLSPWSTLGAASRSTLRAPAPARSRPRTSTVGSRVR